MKQFAIFVGLVLAVACMGVGILIFGWWPLVVGALTGALWMAAGTLAKKATK